jgi:predicted esterase
MWTRQTRSIGSNRIFLAVLALLLLCATCSDADIVILKDGFTLQGKVKRESNTIDEPGGRGITAPKVNGFYTVDDGVRRIVFSQRQLQDVAATDTNRNADLNFERRFKRLDNWRLPPGIPAGTTSWDARWDRVIKLDSQQGKVSIAQHVSLLSPECVLIDAKRYNWSPYYFPREFDVNEILRLLHDHPDYRSPSAAHDFNKRFRIFRFLREAGWEERARVELETLAREFPDQKDKIEAARESFQKELTAGRVDQVELAEKAGRHDWAQANLASLPRKDLDEKQQVRLRTIDGTYETLNKNLALARRYLVELPSRVSAPQLRGLVGEAAATIGAELNLDTADRLEAFVTQAQQAERDGLQSHVSPEQIMALAVTGWHLGNAVAESKVETMVRVWHTRKMVLEYQRTHDSMARKRLVERYEKSEGVAFDELAQVIRFLPPPDAFETAIIGQSSLLLSLLPTPGATIHRAFSILQQALPAPRYDLTVNLASGIHRGTKYLVQLPPEYHAGRSYPVLFVLHEAGGKPADLLNRWSLLAARNGYFLVAPEWDSAGNLIYGFSDVEHAAVLDVLRDLRRRFQVDSDRVFVSGFGEGANMAFDVALSHPDQFAGIMPMSGRARYFARQYWHNAQHLPFYVVDGEADGDSAKDNRSLFEHWMPKGYNSLYVQYKGRGHDWFDLELPIYFDWMARKKRTGGFSELGKMGLSGDEFASMRPGDSHFYWLSGEEISDRCINDARHWHNSVSPATLQGVVTPGNQINLTCHGFRRAVVWFGLGMVDFEKPVTFFVNGGISRANRKIAPSLATLLEDFYQRGDRQRLYVAKVEFKP